MSREVSKFIGQFALVYTLGAFILAAAFVLRESEAIGQREAFEIHKEIMQETLQRLQRSGVEIIEVEPSTKG